MRKHYDKEFKAKVAIEAVRGEKTIQELATAYSVHPNLVSLWKKLLIESTGKLFEKEGKDKEAEATEKRQDILYKQIGQLQVENEFLKKGTDNCTEQSRSCRARSTVSFDLEAMRASYGQPDSLLLQATGKRPGSGSRGALGYTR